MKKKSQRVRMNIMNRNTIMSLAMIYALWQSKRQDLIDLIKPFVLFSVGSTTSIGNRIDIDAVCRYLEREFGYKSFQPAVVKKVLNRECSNTILAANRRIKRKNNEFFLSGAYDELIEKFSEKRTNCKTHSDAVTIALAKYLNENNVYRKNNYSQQDAEVILLSFFERRGNTVLLSVDDLSQQLAKDDENDYYVGKFILSHHEQKTAIMEYVIELVKGYFVTTAIYLQAENTNVTHASFSDVVFYLDTRILLGYLGYKTQQENDSIQEMVKSLKKNGAKLACFSYNEDEVESILEAYQQSLLYEESRSPYTLEYFDSLGRKSTLVEAAKKHFRNKLKSDGIISISPSQALENNKLSSSTKGIIDDSSVREIVSRIKPSYRFESFPDDMSAINTVSRLREGKKLPYIEKCKAVFVTSNTILIAATKRYFRDNNIYCGFPIIVSGDDLCVLAWLKDFESDSNLPQMRLLENVMAAITPNREIMDAYFSNLKNLQQQGVIDDDEVSLLRIDYFARKELMELTGGNSKNITDEVIDKIRERIRGDSFSSGVKQGKSSAEKEYSQHEQARRNDVCKRAEQEVEHEYEGKERRQIKGVRIISAIIAAIFVVASVVSLYMQWSKAIVPLLIVTVVTTIQGACAFFNKENFLIKCVKNVCFVKKYLILTRVRRSIYQFLMAIINDEHFYCKHSFLCSVWCYYRIIS